MWLTSNEQHVLAAQRIVTFSLKADSHVGPQKPKYFPTAAKSPARTREKGLRTCAVHTKKVAVMTVVRTATHEEQKKFRSGLNKSNEVSLFFDTGFFQKIRGRVCSLHPITDPLQVQTFDPSPRWSGRKDLKTRSKRLQRQQIPH